MENNMANKETIVGIDLGTGASVVSIFENGEAKVIVNEEGERTTPSIVSYNANGEIVVGSAAKRQAITNPTSTIFAAKRLMGNRYTELTDVEKNFPYKVKAGKNDMAVIEVGENTLTPQEVGAKILQKLKKAAENYLGHSVNKAVITCPAFFNDSQRQATKDAGEIAGFKVERVIAEPTAAALAFGLGKDKKGIYAIYDYGSGTFDCSILDIDGDIIETLATSGDVYLGGTDLDDEIIKWMAAEFKKTDGISLLSDKMAFQRLKDSAERAKIELSTTPSTTINIPFITADATGPRHLTLTLSKSQFEQMAEAYVAKTIQCCKRALSDAKKSKSDITEVLLVGGSSRIPLVQKMVKDFFEQEPNKSMNPDEAVALGASIQAGVLAGDVKDLLLLDVCPLTLGIETYGGIATPLVERNTTIPTRKTQIFSTASDGQTSVEVVVLQGERKLSKDNRLLGRFHLDGIPAAPRGVPQIEVSYDIDANGILSVHAKDKASNKEQKITITASSGLSKDEVSRMQDDAQKYEEEDKKKVEQISIRNSAEMLVYSTDKTLNESGEKITDDVRADVRMKIDNLKDALTKDDYDMIKKLQDELMQASFKMLEVLYKHADNTSASVADNVQTDNVVEAEVVE
jgi:molecular chaperone DnaK